MQSVASGNPGGPQSSSPGLAWGLSAPVPDPPNQTLLGRSRQSYVFTSPPGPRRCPTEAENLCLLATLLHLGLACEITWGAFKIDDRSDATARAD